MNPKYSLALLLAIQVSVGLAQFPEPDKELVEKFQNLMNEFHMWLLYTNSKIAQNVHSAVDWLTDGQADAIEVNFQNTMESYIERLQLRGFVFASAVFAGAIVHEAARLMDKASTAGLGLYSKYLRPHVSTYLDEAINNTKTVLDKYLPAK